MTTITDYQSGVYGLASAPVTALKGLQAGVYALGTAPAANVLEYQGGLLGLTAAESSTGLYRVKAFQAGVYALVRGIVDRRDLRAWTFTQDDHDFYVLQLGVAKTLIYDKHTKQWAEWKSPTYNYWRGNDGVDWKGFNVACDPLSGKIFKIDPAGRLDYGTTSIVSIIHGGFSDRMRTIRPMFMAELAMSEAIPPPTIDPTTVGITLRSSDTVTFVNHGLVPGLSTGNKVYARWYGLGLIQSPGVLFELTDTGYARRIDGFTLEMGGGNG